VKQKLSALMFVAAFVAMQSATPANANTLGPLIATISIDSGLFVIDEYSNQYVVHNNSTNLWIWGFAVTNPNPGGSANYKGWAWQAVPLGNNVNTVDANGYLASGASLDSNYNPILPLSYLLDNFIIPGETTIADSFFHVGATASDAAVVTVDANGDINEFQSFARTSDTPLPATLPLFAAGLGALGLLGWRKKRKAVAGAA
jgi:hypothetical protein